MGHVYVGTCCDTHNLQHLQVHVVGSAEMLYSLPTRTADNTEVLAVYM